MGGAVRVLCVIWKTLEAVILFMGLATMVIRLNEDWNKKAERNIKPYIRLQSTNTAQTYHSGAWIGGRLSLAHKAHRERQRG